MPYGEAMAGIVLPPETAFHSLRRNDRRFDVLGASEVMNLIRGEAGGSGHTRSTRLDEFDALLWAPPCARGTASPTAISRATTANGMSSSCAGVLFTA